MSKELTINDIERERFDAIEQYFNEWFECTKEDSTGVVSVHDVPVKYAYDPAEEAIAITITEDTDRVTPAKVRTLLATLGKQYDEAKVGKYNQVEIRIKNTTNMALIYSENTVESGEIGISEHRIDERGTEAVLAIEANSSTLSGIGCQGSATYTFDDGDTTLTIDYKLNGVGIHSFEAGIKGVNIRAIDYSVTGKDPSYDGCKAVTFLKPTVHVKPAK